MATILRDLSYRYQWLYDTISRLASLTVGGEARFRHLALNGLTISPLTKILDLCCGSGQATQVLVQYSPNVTGLDASPLSLERARRNVPDATFTEGWAEKMPFASAEFDLVHISAALHEMDSQQLNQILQEVYRVLKPGGVFTLVDFHQPHNFLLWPGLAIFLWLFETETAWQLINSDLWELLEIAGFNVKNQSNLTDDLVQGDLPKKMVYAGGSLQVIQLRK